MLDAVYAAGFPAELRRAVRRGADRARVAAAVDLLRRRLPLPQAFDDRQLDGDHYAFHDCLVGGGFALVYLVDSDRNLLVLVRIVRAGEAFPTRRRPSGFRRVLLAMKRNPVPIVAAACAVLVLGTFALRAAGPAPDAVPAPTPFATPAPAAAPAVAENPFVPSAEAARAVWDRTLARARGVCRGSFFVPESARFLPREELAVRLDEVLHDENLEDVFLFGCPELLPLARERALLDPTGVADCVWSLVDQTDDEDDADAGAFFDALVAARDPFPRLEAIRDRLWAPPEDHEGDGDRLFANAFLTACRARVLHLLDAGRRDECEAFSRRFDRTTWVRNVVAELVEWKSDRLEEHHRTDAWLSLYESIWRDCDEGNFYAGACFIGEWMACYRALCEATGREERFRRTLETTSADPKASPAWRLACLANLPASDDPAEEDRRYRAFVEAVRDPAVREGLEYGSVDVFDRCVARYRALEAAGRTNELDGVAADLEALVLATPFSANNWLLGERALADLGRADAAARVRLAFAEKWAEDPPVDDLSGGATVPPGAADLPAERRTAALNRLLHDPRVETIFFNGTPDSLRKEAQALALADPAGVSEGVWWLDGGSEEDDAFFDAIAAARHPFERLERLLEKLDATPPRQPRCIRDKADARLWSAFACQAARVRAGRYLLDDRWDRFEAFFARFGEKGRGALADSLGRSLRGPLETEACARFFETCWPDAMRAKPDDFWSQSNWFDAARRACGDERFLRLLDAMESAPDLAPDWRLRCLEARAMM